MTQIYVRIDNAAQLFTELGSYMCVHTCGPAFDSV